ncbi:hypothetical protein BsWGS_03402 [Bradybaena similaris]
MPQLARKGYLNTILELKRRQILGTSEMHTIRLGVLSQTPWKMISDKMLIIHRSNFSSWPSRNGSNDMLGEHKIYNVLTGDGGSFTFSLTSQLLPGHPLLFN